MGRDKHSTLCEVMELHVCEVEWERERERESTKHVVALDQYIPLVCLHVYM